MRNKDRKKCSLEEVGDLQTVYLKRSTWGLSPYHAEAPHVLGEGDRERREKKAGNRTTFKTQEGEEDPRGRPGEAELTYVHGSPLTPPGHRYKALPAPVDRCRHGVWFSQWIER